MADKPLFNGIAPLLVFVGGILSLVWMAEWQTPAAAAFLLGFEAFLVGLANLWRKN